MARLSAEIRENLALGATIALWSASPILLVRSAGLLPPEVTPSIAVIAGTAMLTAFFGATDARVVRDAWELVRFRLIPANGAPVFKSYARYVTLSLLGFVAYPWLYVQAMQGASRTGQDGRLAGPVVVNILNYLWPCAAVVLAHFLAKEPLTRRSTVGVVLALSGALIAVGSTVNTQTWVLSYLYHRASPGAGGFAFTRDSWFYLFAIAGALAWGAYTATLPLCRFNKKESGEVSPSAFFLGLLTGAVPVHVVLLLNQWRVIAEFEYHWTSLGLVAFAVYSCGSIGIAHCLFAFVRRGQTISLPAIAASTYWVFALGTLLLHFSEGGPSSPPLATGFGLLVTGMYISRDRTLFSPIAGFIIFFVISYNLAVIFEPPPGWPPLEGRDEFYVTFLGALTAVFAIISGFVLSRVISLHAEREQAFVAMIRSCGQAASALGPNGNTLPVQHFAAVLQDAYLARCGSSTTPVRDELEIQQRVDREFERFQFEIDRAADAPHVQNPVRHHLIDIRQAFCIWSARCMDKVSAYEWLVLIALATTCALAGYRVRNAEPAYALGRAAFDASLVVIMLAIADYERGRPSNAPSAVRSAFMFMPESCRPPAVTLDGMLSRRVSELLIVATVILIGLVWSSSSV